jgi:hypothetical protein
MSTATDLYEQDFYAWTQEQAAKLRAGQPAGLDWERLAEEIEDMGSSKITQIENRLGQLLAHLLKWARYPEGAATVGRARSWNNGKRSTA